MSDIVYRFRFSIALGVALAVGMIASVTFPIMGGGLQHTVSAAATPGCSGTQNPFIGS